MYAIVRVGGKQYRVEKGDSLVVDRLRASEGDKLNLEPLLFRSDDDKTVFGGSDLEKVKVEAVVSGHERGRKLHVLKFKPKRGYKRRSGHRSELTRLEIGDIKLLARKPAAKGDAGAGAAKAGAGASGAGRGKSASSDKAKAAGARKSDQGSGGRSSGRKKQEGSGGS